MRYRMYIILMSVGAAACVLSIVAWGLSYTAPNVWRFPSVDYKFASAHGAVTFAPPNARIFQQPGGGYSWFAFGSEPDVDAAGRVTERFHVLVPYWAVFTLMVALMMWPPHLARRMVYQARHRHLCVYCGYDLRATPARCPECGEVPR